MRIRLRSMPGVIVIFAAAIAFALPTRAQSEDAILAVLTQWSEIYATATDAAEMQALYHPDAVFFGTGGAEPMVGAAAFGPYFQNQFDNFTDRQHAFVDPVIRFYGEDVATATGLYRFTVTPLAGGGPIEVLYRYTFALARIDGVWLIVQHHSSQIPQ